MKSKRISLFVLLLGIATLLCACSDNGAGPDSNNPDSDPASIEWQVYTPGNSGLPSTNIQGVTAGRNVVYVGLSSPYKLMEFRNGLWKDIPTDRVSTIVGIDENGHLWGFRQSDKVFLRWDGSVWLGGTPSPIQGLAGNTFAFAVNSKGRCVIANILTGVEVYDRGNWSHNDPFPASLKNSDNQYWDEVVYSGEHIWMSNPSSYGLLRYQPDTKEFTQFTSANSLLPVTSIREMIEDRRGGIWVASGTGIAEGARGAVSHIDASGKWEVYDYRNSEFPEHYGVNSMAVTDDGSLWLAGGENAGWPLLRFDGRNWTQFNQSNGFPYHPKNINGLGANNTIWASIRNVGLVSTK